MKIIISINNKLKKYQIGPGKRYKIGQASDCDITVSYETVSRSHLLIWEESGKLFVDSRNRPTTHFSFIAKYLDNTLCASLCSSSRATRCPGVRGVCVAPFS